MTNHIGPATWYVPKHQGRNYENAGAYNIGLGSDTNVTIARNQAMEDAFQWKLPCVQIDDDMKWIKRVIWPDADHPKNRAETFSAEAAIQRILLWMEDLGFYLGGTAPTNNPYFSRQPVSTRTFVRSPFWVIRPNPLRLDPKLLVKFDYDYTLQHIEKFGGVCRVDEFVTEFDYGKLPGGHVDSRTMDTQEQAIDYLQHKWGPKIVRRNPRRPGEVLLNVPRPQRVVMT
jgi:hypothetical protein